MKLYILSALIGFTLISCSKKGVEGFRDIKLGMSVDEALQTADCKKGGSAESGQFNTFLVQHNMKEFRCFSINIDNKEHSAALVFHDNKLVRIEISLGEPTEKTGTEFYDSLTGTYGEANTSKNLFITSFQVFNTSKQMGTPNLKAPYASWANGTVELFGNADAYFLYYEIEDWNKFLQKIQAQGKGL